MNPLNITDTIQHILFSVNTSVNLCLVNKKFNENIKSVRSTSIDTNDYKKITNVILSTLVKSLTYLKLSGNSMIITNDGIKEMTWLTSLILDGNKVITNDGIKGLALLTSLDLVITSLEVSQMTILRGRRG